jgi:hypothetical protein
MIHTHTHYESSGRVISPSQRPLPDNIQHSQQIDIHATGGIRTRNFNKRAAVDHRLRTARVMAQLDLILVSQKESEDRFIAVALSLQSQIDTTGNNVTDNGEIGNHSITMLSRVNYRLNRLITLAHE